MGRDLAFGTATLALSAAYYWMAAAIPESQLADAIGPQGLPKTYAVLLGGLSLILIVRSLRRARTDNRNAPPSPFPLLPETRAARGRERWVINKVRALCTWYSKGLDAGSHLRTRVNTAASLGQLRGTG